MLTWQEKIEQVKAAKTIFQSPEIWRRLILDLFLYNLEIRKEMDGQGVEQKDS